MRKLTDPIGKLILRFLANEEVKEEALDRINNARDDFEEAENRFLAYFEKRTLRWGSLTILLLLLIGAIDLLSCGTFPNQSYGLGLDLLGAMILGVGLLKGHYSIAAESTSYFNKSLFRQESLAQDAVDGVWGISLLIVGILLQLLAVMGISVYTMETCLAL